MAAATTEERFWEKVQRKDGCWLWIAACNWSGYGVFRAGDHGNVLAHRYSWELAHGKIPNGVKILHKCDTPKCVNPEHLFPGTQKDNVDDMIQKGRKVQVFGETNWSAKLTDAEVLRLRAMRKAGATQVCLSNLFRISRWAVRQVIAGQTWKHLPI